MTMKRLVLSVFALFVSVAPPSTHAQQKIVIKIGTIAPEGSTWHDVLLKIRQEWRELSQTRVELRIYAGGDHRHVAQITFGIGIVEHLSEGNRVRRVEADNARAQWPVVGICRGDSRGQDERD